MYVEILSLASKQFRHYTHMFSRDGSWLLERSITVPSTSVGEDGAHSQRDEIFGHAYTDSSTRESVTASVGDTRHHRPLPLLFFLRLQCINLVIRSTLLPEAKVVKDDVFRRSSGSAIEATEPRTIYYFVNGYPPPGSSTAYRHWDDTSLGTKALLQNRIQLQ